MKVFVCIAVLAMMSAGSTETEKEWTNLLDTELSQWDTYLSYRHSIDYNGNIPVNEKGEPVPVIGYNTDPAKVFSTSKLNGETVLRISGEIYGCIFTKKEFENYHLTLKVKWGSRKDVPRKDKLKDSGILYHSIGDAGVDYWRAWMLSQEFQIMEGHMGDYWNIATSAIDIRAFLPEGQMNSIANEYEPFLKFGSGAPEGFCLRSENHETRDGWTTLDLICFEDKSLHIVNGHPVMILTNSRYVKDGKTVPLTRGRIQLQSEAAEVFFKDVRIRSISSLPKEYESFYH